MASVPSLGILGKQHPHMDDPSKSNGQESSPNGKNILLVEDHDLIRQSLTELIQRHTVHQIVASTGIGREAVSLAVRLRPEMILMDYGLGRGIEGIELLKSLRSAAPASRIIVLSAHNHHQRREEVMKAGAVGLVSKSDPPEILFSALDCVAAGLSVPGESVAKHNHNGTLPDDRLRGLSDREREVLRLVARGLTVREMAEKLGISRKTVEAHRANARVKLALENCDGLRQFAREYFGCPDES